MRAILVIVLVILVLLLGLPMAMGMAGSAFCPDCDSHGPLCPPGVCSLILTAFALVARGLARSVPLGASRAPRLLLARAVDRPPPA
jgi:hypothetical protein